MDLWGVLAMLLKVRKAEAVAEARDPVSELAGVGYFSEASFNTSQAL
jgi:hypothetical protein